MDTSKNLSIIYETHKTAPFLPKNSSNSLLLSSFLDKKALFSTFPKSHLGF